MEIIEIKRAKINGEDIFFPSIYWLNIENGLIDKTINIKIENLKFQFNINSNKNLKQICNHNDLKELLGNIYFSIFNLENLRLKIINTKKWGEKIVYNEGAKSLCFSCYYIKYEKKDYMIFFNTDGTKEVENIYIHGIWVMYQS